MNKSWKIADMRTSIRARSAEAELVYVIKDEFDNTRAYVPELKDADRIVKRYNKTMTWRRENGKTTLSHARA